VQGKAYGLSQPQNGPVRFRLETGNETYTVLASSGWYWKDLKTQLPDGSNVVVRGSKTLGNDMQLYIVAQKIRLPDSGRTLVLRDNAGKPSGRAGAGRRAHRADSWGAVRWEAGSVGWVAAWAAGGGSDMGVLEWENEQYVSRRRTSDARRRNAAGGGRIRVAGWEVGTKLGFDSNVGRSIHGGKSDAYLLAYGGFSREPSGESRGDWVFSAVAEGAAFASVTDLDYAAITLSPGLVYSPHAGWTITVAPILQAKTVKDTDQSAVAFGGKIELRERLGEKAYLAEHYAYRDSRATSDIFSYKEHAVGSSSRGELDAGPFQ
jgi:hypothetical protein